MDTEKEQRVLIESGTAGLQAKLIGELRAAGHDVVVTDGQRTGRNTLREIEEASFKSKHHSAGFKANMLLATAAGMMASLPGAGGFSGRREVQSGFAAMDYAQMELRVHAASEAIAKAEAKRQRKMERNKALLAKQGNRNGNE